MVDKDETHSLIGGQPCLFSQIQPPERRPATEGDGSGGGQLDEIGSGREEN
jgi:hypothetical protein